MIDPISRDLAEAGYRAYSENTGGKTFDGRDMPAFEDLPHRTVAAWAAAAEGIAGQLLHDGPPADVFDFSTALRALKDGQRLTRRGWNAPDQWVELQVPDAHSKMQRPYTYLSPADGALVPWVPSVSDMLAEDWEIVG